MVAKPTNKIPAIVAAVVIVTAGLGYWGYNTHQRNELRNAVAKLLKDSGSRLRDAVGIETAPPTTDRASFVKRLAEHAAATERSYEHFKRLELARDRPLTDAADDYLLTVREIARKQLDSLRQRLLLTASLQALADHMRADDRTGAWVQDAVKAKDQVNKDYRGYQLATEAYGKLLDAVSSSQRKIAPYVDKTLLIEDAVLADTRRRALEEARRIAADIERIRQPGALR